MGDADKRGVVAPRDDLDTIDGVVTDASRPPLVIAKSGPLADYAGLVSVDKSHYDFGETIGRGGMGHVVKARDRRLGRRVAIKELLPSGRDAARRFEREARITARLQHPAIVHVYEAGVWAGGEPFYAMNHVDGERMSEVIKHRPELDDRLALLPNVIAVAEALAYAHNENVIHRDLKPSNILIGAFGETVVIDWGLAKDLGAPIDPQESLAMRRHAGPDETNDGSVVGTPAYMPPEQARGEAVDRRADVYSLGALLYHVITRQPPYEGKHPEDTLERVKAGACAPIEQLQPATPVDLVTIVRKAMARDPAERYADASEIVDELRAFQAGQLIAARNYPPWERLARWLRKHRVTVGIATAAVVAIAIVGSLSISRIVDEKRKEERRRNSLLEERGRSELLAGQAGRAVLYLAEAAKDGAGGGARGLLLADALRPFEAQLAELPSNGLPNTVAFGADGSSVLTLATQIHMFADGRDRWFGAWMPRSQLLISGTRVVTVDGFRVIRIWAPTGALERELPPSSADLLSADLNGRYLATGSADGTARVWDLETGTSVVGECGDDSPVIAVRLSPDSKSVVSATDDNVMCYWEAAGGKISNLLRGHRGRIQSIRWSPDKDRRLVLTASADGTALLWDPFYGKPVLQPITHDGRAIASAEFSSDGRLVVTAGADQLARLWAIPDELPADDPSLRAKELRRFVGHAAALTTAVFDSKDERIATAGADNKAKVWDVATGELLATFEHAGAVTTARFSPDDKRLLTASSDLHARVWDLEHGAAKRPFEVDAVVHAIAVSPDGSVAAARADSRISVWRPTRPDAQLLRDHASRVLALAYSPDGRLLASGGEDAEGLIFDGGARPRVLAGHRRPIRSIAFFPDGTALATAGDEGLVRVWSATGTLSRTLRHTAPIIQLAIARDGTLAAVDDQGRVVTWIGDTSSPSAIIGARSIAFSDDGTTLVASGGETKLYAVRAGVIGRELLTVDGPTGEVRAVAFTRDGACVITAGEDGLVQLWDADKGKLLGTRGTRSASIHALAISHDGTTLWVGGGDQLVRAWDIHAELRDVAALGTVMARVPWELDDVDVVRRREN